MSAKNYGPASPDDDVVGTPDVGDEVRRKEALRETRALQTAIFNSVNFSSIATDANGVIQIFNVGAERMLGYTAAEVMNQITPADISDPQGLIARARALSVELETPITPGFEALVSRPRAGSKISTSRSISARMAAGSRRWCPSRRCATRRTPSSAICSSAPTTP